MNYWIVFNHSNIYHAKKNNDLYKLFLKTNFKSVKFLHFTTVNLNSDRQYLSGFINLNANFIITIAVATICACEEKETFETGLLCYKNIVQWNWKIRFRKLNLYNIDLLYCWTFIHSNIYQDCFDRRSNTIKYIGKPLLLLEPTCNINNYA